MPKKILITLWEDVVLLKKHKLLFIHIPKTAGLSVCNAFGSNTQTHNPLSHYESLCDVSEYFKFTIVRNPWDRFLSAYFYLKGSDRVMKAIEQGNINIERLHDKISEFDTFDDFCEYSRETPRLMKFNVHFRPQVSFLEDGIFDFIGRYENLSASLRYVCDVNDIPMVDIPHINQSDHLHYAEYYNSNTIELVQDFYAEDIKRFGYKFN